MHRPVKDPNKFVYHYTKSKKAIEYILKNKTLLLNPYNKTNDPLETKIWYLNIEDGINRIHSAVFNSEKKKIINELWDFNSNQEKKLDKIKSNFKLICFTRDNPNQPKSPSDTSGFLRGWGHPRMWAQYAENHKGICLMFDRDALNNELLKSFSNDKVYSGEVEYLNEPISKEIKSLGYEELMKFGINKIIDKAIEENIEGFFFKKALDWQHEFEYRWIVKSDEESKGDSYIPISSSLRAIILGADVSKDDENELINFSQNLRVRVYKMDWTNGCPYIDKGPYLPWVDEFDNPV